MLIQKRNRDLIGQRWKWTWPRVYNFLLSGKNVSHQSASSNNKIHYLRRKEEEQLFSCLKMKCKEWKIWGRQAPVRTTRTRFVLAKILKQCCSRRANIATMYFHSAICAGKFSFPPLFVAMSSFIVVIGK